MDHNTLRGGRRSIIFAAISSLGPSKRGIAPTNLAALVRGATNAFMQAYFFVVLPWVGARSAGRELTTSSTLQPFISSAVAKARARVVFPAAGGPKSSTIIDSRFARENDTRCCHRGSRAKLESDHTALVHRRLVCHDGSAEPGPIR